jgi:hypothetical protein
MSPTTILLVSVQQGFQKARELSKQRRACQDPRSSLGWTGEQEEAFKSVNDDSRNGQVFWVGAKNESA